MEKQPKHADEHTVLMRCVCSRCKVITRYKTGKYSSKSMELSKKWMKWGFPWPVVISADTCNRCDKLNRSETKKT